MLRPAWCHQAQQSAQNYKIFSLYAYVQRNHWNVGLFRYYQWKQMPNFLLAMPVLLLGIVATVTWIALSWDRYWNHTAFACSTDTSNPKTNTAANNRNKSQQANMEKGSAITTLVNYTKHFFRWTTFAFVESSTCYFHHFDVSSPPFNNHHDKERLFPSSTTTTTTEKEPTTTTSTIYESYQLPNVPLMGPAMLTHYAVLAGVCILGATIAHVQITTRMVCSTCPAFYWFLLETLDIRRHQKHGNDDDHDDDDFCKILGGSLYMKKTHLLFLLRAYLVGFNLVGTIMHVHWLPWT